jgi:hypothetical protein
MATNVSKLFKSELFIEIGLEEFFVAKMD